MNPWLSRGGISECLANGKTNSKGSWGNSNYVEQQESLPGHADASLGAKLSVQSPVVYSPHSPAPVSGL